MRRMQGSLGVTGLCQSPRTSPERSVTDIGLKPGKPGMIAGNESRATGDAVLNTAYIWNPGCGPSIGLTESANTFSQGVIC